MGKEGYTVGKMSSGEMVCEDKAGILNFGKLRGHT